MCIQKNTSLNRQLYTVIALNIQIYGLSGLSGSF